MFIPADVLDELASDHSIDHSTRAKLKAAADFEAVWRKLRDTNEKTVKTAKATLAGAVALPYPPAIRVFDCQNGTGLPGQPVSNPQTSADLTAKRAHDETKAVAQFYQQVFGRNSIDNAGMSLISSVHYGQDYANAFWNGLQMTYGDGDNRIFIDFTKSLDVIAHELTHGVTQHSSGFRYSGQAGGLNESMSDVFGSMFMQWRLNQNVSQASWLIGAGIMGPDAISRGFRCLRDMANPQAAHSLSKQPMHISQYTNNMGPHTASGIPNHAFYHAAQKAGGNSWQTVGPAWYDALTSYGQTPGIGFAAFAARTRKAAANAAIRQAIDFGWQQVGL
jgi:Zn-dependent metalloprotease